MRQFYRTDIFNVHLFLNFNRQVLYTENVSSIKLVD